MRNLNSNDLNNKQLENNYNDQEIEKRLKLRKHLTGVIRINKLQNYDHGYITVSGINNDILIRRKNLYQCLNLDELVVELLLFYKLSSFFYKR